MSRKRRIKFRFGPIGEGGHSLFKVFGYHFDNSPVEIRDRYSFNGALSPSQKPEMYADERQVAAGRFRNFEIGLQWSQARIDALLKENPRIARLYIADSDYGTANAAAKVWKEYKIAKTQPERKNTDGFLYRMRLKCESQYVEFDSNGIADLWGEWHDSEGACLTHIIAQYARWQTLNANVKPEKGFVFGTGKMKLKDTRSMSQCRIYFDPQSNAFRRPSGAIIALPKMQMSLEYD